ncbi:MAG: peptidylprolyl isomerase [Acidimicrobiales bacterium]
MGTAKRERQKAGRQARLEEARREQKKAETRKRFSTTAIIVVVFIAVLGVVTLLRSRDNKSSEQSTTATTAAVSSSTTGTAIPVGATITGPTPCPPTDGSAQRTTTFSEAPPMCIDPAKTYTATVSTTKGDFTITLDAKSAPKTVNNFVVLSRYGFYDGVPFHRVVKDFVIQTGDPNGVARGKPGQDGPGYSIPDENPPDTSVYTKGSVAMANTGQPNTGGSQWFVLTGSTPLPSATYPKFGQVTQGLDTTVAAIAATAPPSGDGQPTDPTTINKITIAES